VRRPIVAAASVVATMAAFVAVYPMYPQITYTVGQTFGPAPAATASAVAESPVAAGNEVRIPKIGVRTAILESDSLDILNKKEGVWHQSGTLGVDNFVLAGHRWKYLPPNTSTLYHLGKLQEGDTIVVDWFKKRYIYTVKQVLTAREERTDLIQPTAKPRLTIYTCNDKQETERIVVIAEPEE
jgi:LPXTG-site transpeptidase (sortase) family protein